MTAGGNYSAGGVTLASVTYSQTSGVATLDAANFSIAANAGNPTNARWFIIYNDTASGKQCISFTDLGSDIDMTTSTINFNVNASGLTTITVN